MIDAAVHAPPVSSRNTDLVWHIETVCPRDWTARMTQFGAGFFHSPPGLQLNTPSGEPVFGTLYQGERVIGLATGVWNQCRLSGRPRHFSAPTLPVVEDASLRHAALVSWRARLAQEGAAEVLLDSYDGWEVELQLAAPRSRREYLIPLGDGPERIAARFADTHRRHLERGRREGWSLRNLASEDALTALREVQHQVAHRHQLRGDGMDLRLPTMPRLHATDAAQLTFWGVQTFAASHDGALLAAVLVGWANQRAYYILGGSTPEGYRRSAAVWLHWRVMGELAEHGCAVYNLGGIPASAVQPEDPAHGLLRFKSGFGADAVRCRGAYWHLRPGHLRMHRIAGWVFATLRRGRRVEPSQLSHAAATGA